MIAKLPKVRSVTFFCAFAQAEFLPNNYVRIARAPLEAVSKLLQCKFSTYFHRGLNRWGVGTTSYSLPASLDQHVTFVATGTLTFPIKRARIESPITAYSMEDNRIVSAPVEFSGHRFPVRSTITYRLEPSSPILLRDVRVCSILLCPIVGMRMRVGMQRFRECNEWGVGGGGSGGRENEKTESTRARWIASQKESKENK